MRLLSRGLIALAPLMLTSCNYLSAPSSSILNRCFRLSTTGSIGGPLSTLLEGFKSKGFTVSWSRGAGGIYILRESRTDPLKHQTHVVAIGLKPVDGTLPDEHGCGPDAIVPTAITADDEEQSVYAGEDFLVRIMEDTIRSRRASAPHASPIEPLSNQVAAAPPEDSDADEIAADQDHYAERQRQNLPKAIVVTHEGQNYCCVTLQGVVDRLRQQGAQVALDAADDGTVWLDVSAPRGTWRGYKHLTFEFDANGGNQLILDRVNNGDDIIAVYDGVGNNSDYALLKEQFELRPSPD